MATAALGLLVGLVVMPIGLVLVVLCGTAAALIGSVDRNGAGTPRSAWLALGGFALGAAGFVALDNDPLRPRDTRTPEVAGVLIREEPGQSYTVRLADGSERALTGPMFGSSDTGDLLLAGSAPTPWIVAVDLFAGPECFQARTTGVDDGTHVIMRVPANSAIALRLAKAPGFDPGGSRDGRYVGLADGLLGRQAGVGAPGRPDGAAPALPALIGYFCLDAEGRVVSWNA
jgi:hypothetical protein